MSQDTNKMSGLVKVAIILVLAVAVGAVVVMKQSEQVEEGQALSPSSESDTNKAPIPKLLDLGATKCIPCKMMAPILEALKEEYKGQFDVVFIDVWENPAESRKHNINLIPTQIFFDADGKELFRHEGFYSKEDILGKWKELDITFGEAKPVAAAEESISFSRWEPALADTRAPENICYMCDGDIDDKTRVVLTTEKGDVSFCSPHCYFIMCSSMVPPKSDHDDAMMTKWDTGERIPATEAAFLVSADAKNRPVVRAFADETSAAAAQQDGGGNILALAALYDQEMSALCGFCDRSVYPADACAVKVEGGLNTWGCCTMCALGVAARLQKDIEITAEDALTEEPIVIRTVSGQVSALEPSTSVAWAGTKKTAEGKMVSTGCFKQAFFVNEDNLQKWVEVHPTATGRAISINQALQEKMQLTAEQISKACKIGECVPK